MNKNKCRLCGKWQTDRHTGPMYKYSTRHYAHARCGMVRWGVEWLDKQPDYVIREFPFFLAQDMGIEYYLRKRLDSMHAERSLI